jgi:hypothetical protein
MEHGRSTARASFRSRFESIGRKSDSDLNAGVQNVGLGVADELWQSTGPFLPVSPYGPHSHFVDSARG